MEKLYQRVTLKEDERKGGFIDTPLKVWEYLIEDGCPNDYDVTPVWMTEQKFKQLNDFEGF